MTIVGIILILIGLSALTGLPLFNFIFAVVLVIIGIRLIMGHGFGFGGPRNWRRGNNGSANDGDQSQDQGHAYHGHSYESQRASSEDWLNEVAVFSPLNKQNTSQNFKGGKIVMVFSGGTLDLRGAKAAGNEVELEVSSTFSSIEIIIPRNWKVRSMADAFAGHVDTRAAQDGEGEVTLILRGSAAFGEIEILK